MSFFFWLFVQYFEETISIIIPPPKHLIWYEWWMAHTHAITLYGPFRDTNVIQTPDPVGIHNRAIHGAVPSLSCSLIFVNTILFQQSNNYLCYNVWEVLKLFVEYSYILNNMETILDTVVNCSLMGAIDNTSFLNIPFSTCRFIRLFLSKAT